MQLTTLRAYGFFCRRIWDLISARASLCVISHSPPGRNLLLSGSARLTLMTMQNDQNRRPGFLENAMGHGSLVVVAIIAVVFVSMVLHLL